MDQANGRTLIPIFSLIPINVITIVIITKTKMKASSLEIIITISRRRIVVFIKGNTNTFSSTRRW